MIASKIRIQMTVYIRDKIFQIERTKRPPSCVLEHHNR